MEASSSGGIGMAEPPETMEALVQQVRALRASLESSEDDKARRQEVQMGHDNIDRVVKAAVDILGQVVIAGEGEATVLKGPHEDLESCLNALGILKEVAGFFSQEENFKSGEGFLSHINTLLSEYSLIIEGNFQKYMITHRKPINPDRLLGWPPKPQWASDGDSESSSENSGVSNHLSQILAAAIDRTPKLILPMILPVSHSLAQQFFQDRKQNPCDQIYCDACHLALELCVWKLAVEKLSKDDVERSPLDTLEAKIGKWTKFMGTVMTLLLPGERKLCDEDCNGMHGLKSEVFASRTPWTMKQNNWNSRSSNGLLGRRLYSTQVHSLDDDEPSPDYTVTVCLNGSFEDFLESYNRALEDICLLCYKHGKRLDISQIYGGCPEMFTTPTSGFFWLKLVYGNDDLLFPIQLKNLYFTGWKGKNGAFVLEGNEDTGGYNLLKNAKVLTFRENYRYLVSKKGAVRKNKDAVKAGPGDVKVGPVPIRHGFKDLVKFDGRDYSLAKRGLAIMAVNFSEAVRLRKVSKAVKACFLNYQVPSLDSDTTEGNKNSDWVTNYGSKCEDAMEDINDCLLHHKLVSQETAETLAEVRIFLRSAMRTGVFEYDLQPPTVCTFSQYKSRLAIFMLDEWVCQEDIRRRYYATEEIKESTQCTHFIQRRMLNTLSFSVTKPLSGKYQYSGLQQNFILHPFRRLSMLPDTSFSSRRIFQEAAEKGPVPNPKASEFKFCEDCNRYVESTSFRALRFGGSSMMGSVDCSTDTSANNSFSLSRLQEAEPAQGKAFCAPPLPAEDLKRLELASAIPESEFLISLTPRRWSWAPSSQ